MYDQAMAFPFRCSNKCAWHNSIRQNQTIFTKIDYFLCLMYWSISFLFTMVSFFCHFFLPGKNNWMNKTSTIYWVGKKISTHWIVHTSWNRMRSQQMKWWWHIATEDQICSPMARELVLSNPTNQRNHTLFY